MARRTSMLIKQASIYSSSLLLRHAATARISSSSSSRPFNLCGRGFGFRNAHSQSTSVESSLLTQLKNQFTEVSHMQPPPKISPPRPFVVIKGCLDKNGPVLSRTYNEEEIKISARRLANFSLQAESDGADEDSYDQLFLMVIITKGSKGPALQFLCDLYVDALGIQSVSVHDRSEISDDGMILPQGYANRTFYNIDQDLQLAFREYLDERGINEELFRFLQAWLYVKEHRELAHWIKSVGTFIAKQTT